MEEFYFLNARSGPQPVAIEPWAESFTLQPGEAFRLTYKPEAGRQIECDVADDVITIGCFGDDSVLELRGERQYLGSIPNADPP